MIDRHSPESTMPDLALLDELVTAPAGHSTWQPFMPAHISAAGHSDVQPFELET